MKEWLAAALTAVATGTDGARPSEPAAPTISQLVAIASKLPPVPEVSLGGGQPLVLSTLADSIQSHHPLLAAAQERLRQ
ncbi:MAG: hypothetical protein AAFV29_12530, partial [Myxococcota bacterium]